MPQRELNHRSLIAGLLFIAIGVAFLIDQATGIEVNVQWVFPALLIGLGIAGLASSASRHLGRQHELD